MSSRLHLPQLLLLFDKGLKRRCIGLSLPTLIPTGRLKRKAVVEAVLTQMDSQR